MEKLNLSLKNSNIFLWNHDKILIVLFNLTNNNFIRLIEWPKILEKIRKFAADFEQQDMLYVEERKEEQDSKFTIFDVRQKINNKLVAKIIINKIFGKRSHVILVINSFNIHIVPIECIFKILPVNHEVWITNVGEIDYWATKLLEKMLWLYELPSSKFISK